MDGLEYEQAALTQLDVSRGNPGPGQVHVAEVYALLAAAAELREIQATLARCAAPETREGL